MSQSFSRSRVWVCECTCVSCYAPMVFSLFFSFPFLPFFRLFSAECDVGRLPTFAASNICHWNHFKCRPVFRYFCVFRLSAPFIVQLLFFCYAEKRSAGQSSNIKEISEGARESDDDDNYYFGTRDAHTHTHICTHSHNRVRKQIAFWVRLASPLISSVD